MFKCCLNCNCNKGKAELHKDVVLFKCFIYNSLIVRYQDYYKECKCNNFIPKKQKLKSS